jgi:hypothetical protein
MKKFALQVLLPIILLALSQLVPVQNAVGATCTWNGSSDNNFNLYLNWTGCGTNPPGSSDDVIIASGGNTLKLTSSVSVNSMSISSAATVILSGATITSTSPVVNFGFIQVNFGSSSINALNTSPSSNISIDASNGAASLNVASDFSNNGTIILSTNPPLPTSLATLSVSGGSGTLTNRGSLSTFGVGLAIHNLFAQLDNQGVVTVASNGPLLIGLGSHTNSGSITMNDNATLSQGSFINTGTVKIAAGKSLTALTVGPFINASNGSIDGSGTLDLSSAASFNNSGSLNPGGNLGKLTVLGALPLSSSGSINIELGGTSAGVDYDQVSVSGNATLSGTLNVSLFNAFVPSIGDVFSLLTYGLKTGSFSSTNLPALTGGKGWSIDYGATSTSIKVVDNTPPQVISFTIPAQSSSLAVPVTSFTATDNISVTDYCITEVNNSSACVWSAAAPTNYTASAFGSRILYAWARDAAGNISTPLSANVVVDATPPVVAAFTVPAQSSSLVIPVTTFTATDNISVSGYCITEVNNSSACLWSANVPASYTTATDGVKILYAWARDAAGNTSSPLSANVSVDSVPPVVTVFTMPSFSATRVIPVTSFTATDNVTVTGYCITEVNSSSACVWSANVPTSYTTVVDGGKILYAWARDAAGNISLPKSTIVAVDGTPPVVTAFTVPAGSPTVVIPVTTFTATDNIGVTGYCITEVSSSSTCIWSASAPASYTTAAAATKTLYAWARDAAGNISAPVSANVTIDATPPEVTAFSVPALSSALVIPVTTFTATDNIGVTGYLITESATPPAASTVNLATAPTSYSALSAGTITLYAWARDAAGYVSVPKQASVTITLADVTAPLITAFSVPPNATVLTIQIADFSATDAVGVSGYLVNESATPPLPGDANWSGTAPVSYTATTAGIKTLYAWAKDAAGNISVPRSAGVSIILPDITPPAVSDFIIPPTASSLTVPITSFTATDAGGVSGYLVSESATPPLPGDANWSGTAPASFTFAAAGSRTLYAWARDAAGNISSAAIAHVTIVLPDVTPPRITLFSVPASSTSLIIPVSSFSATDAVGVTGYCVTEVNSSAACIWTNLAPASFAATTAGTKTLYSWARDAAGNISAPVTALVTITLPDTTAPVITSFIVPDTFTSLIVPLFEITASDDVGVTGYLATEGSVAPASSDTGWTSTPPVSYTVAVWGTHALRVFAKDAAGNISAPGTATVTIGTTGKDGVLVPTPGKTEPTIADALKALRFAMGNETPTAEEVKHGDVAPLINGVPHPDGVINLGDAIVILRKVVGL